MKNNKDIEKVIVSCTEIISQCNTENIRGEINKNL